MDPPLIMRKDLSVDGCLNKALFYVHACFMPNRVLSGFARIMELALYTLDSKLNQATVCIMQAVVVRTHSTIMGAPYTFLHNSAYSRILLI